MDAEEFMEVKPVGRGWDLLWMPLLFCVVFGLLSWWPLAGLHPSVWEDVAIASGLRPPGDPFPGLYRIIVSALFQAFPPDTVLKVLMQLGRVCVGLSSVCIYLVFRDALPTALRLRAHVSKVGLRLGRVIAFLSAILFVCAEPVWRAGQTFSPVSLFVLMAAVAGCLFFVFLRRGSIRALYLCFALLGFISAETTLGFLLLILTMVGVLVAVNWSRRPDMPLVNPLVDDLMRAVVFKRLSYVWLGCFVVGVTLNVVQFVLTKGLEATGHAGVLGLLFEYVRGAWESTCQAATGPGWLFALLFCLAPFIFVLNILPKAWDDDKFLPWSVGMCSGVAQMRSQVADLAGDRQGAIREAAMSDMLDKANASVQKMKRDVNWLKMQSGGQLTPREGLVIGLSRGDFAFAGRFAAPVLAADPDDPRANFAMGMMYFQEEKYSKAETHLLRCLVKRPDEPAVLNNLAIVETRLGKFSEAEKHIAKAIEKYPTIPELKKTRENLEKVKADAEAAARPKVVSPVSSEAGKKPQEQNTKAGK